MVFPFRRLARVAQAHAFVMIYHHVAWLSFFAVVASSADMGTESCANKAPSTGAGLLGSDAQIAINQAGCASGNEVADVDLHEGLKCLFERLYPASAKYGGKVDERVRGKELTYGELQPEALSELFDGKGVFGIAASPEDHFIDLGSGTGKLPILALLSQLGAAEGIELAEERHQFAAEALATLQPLLPSSASLQRDDAIGRAELSLGGSKGRVVLSAGDLLKLPLAGATLVFAASLCFPDELLQAVGKKLRQELQAGAIFWTLKELKGENTGLAYAGKVASKSTWSSRTMIHMYIRVPEVPLLQQSASDNSKQSAAWSAAVVAATRAELQRLRTTAGLDTDGGQPLTEESWLKLGLARGLSARRLLRLFGNVNYSNDDRCGCGAAMSADPPIGQWLLTEAGFLSMVAHGIPHDGRGCSAASGSCSLGDAVLDEALAGLRARAKCEEQISNKKKKCGDLRSPMEQLDGLACVRNSEGMIPFYAAAYRGTMSVAALALRDVGPAALLCADREGQGPLHSAAVASNRRSLDFLLKILEGSSSIRQQALTMRDVFGRTPLGVARDAENTRALLDAGTPSELVNDVDNEGATPLYHAVVRRDEALVELLLKLGANASSIGDQHTSPLIAAARTSSGASLIRMLVTHRADPTAHIGSLRTTTLHVAAQRGHLEVAKTLLELRADPRAEAEGKMLPKDLARNAAMVELLEKAINSISSRDSA